MRHEPKKEPKYIDTPLSEEAIKALHAGDRVLLSGTIYTLRDASHKRLLNDLKEGTPAPFDLPGQVIYYTGPCPAKPGEAIGSIGPTTSLRMDKYTPAMLELGIKGLVGKGSRSREVRDAIVKHKAVYLLSVPGVAAAQTQYIEAAEIIAYPELGTEAIHKLTVKDFPLFVANDIYGQDIFETERAKWKS
jgi:fumarate hydratase subunit beta